MKDYHELLNTLDSSTKKMGKKFSIFSFEVLVDIMRLETGINLSHDLIRKCLNKYCNGDLTYLKYHRKEFKEFIKKELKNREHNKFLRACTNKKAFTGELEVQNIVKKAEVKLGYYVCPHCNKFHLTKRKDTVRKTKNRIWKNQ